ncbi:DUF1661 domain-containing protein [Porphyromonas gingivalis]
MTSRAKTKNFSRHVFTIHARLTCTEKS